MVTGVPPENGLPFGNASSSRAMGAESSEGLPTTAEDSISLPPVLSVQRLCSEGGAPRAAHWRG